MVYIGSSLSTTAFTSSLVTAWCNSNSEPTSDKNNLKIIATRKNELMATLTPMVIVLKSKTNPMVRNPMIRKIITSCAVVKVTSAELSGSRFSNSKTDALTYTSPNNL